MKITAQSEYDVEVTVTSRTVAVNIGPGASYNFTADYVLNLHPNEPWLVGSHGEVRNVTISNGQLALIRKEIEKRQQWDAHFDESPEELREGQQVLFETPVESGHVGWTFTQTAGGTAAIHTDGRRYWWPDEMADEVSAEVLGSDWHDVGYTSQDGLDLGDRITINVDGSGLPSAAEYTDRWLKPLRPGLR